MLASWPCKQLLGNARQLERRQRKEQPAPYLPVTFAGNRLMINKQRGGDVSQAMKALPISSAQTANGELVAGDGENNENRQSGGAVPINGFEKLRSNPSNPPS
jgi:hypothetical protein